MFGAPTSLGPDGTIGSAIGGKPVDVPGRGHIGTTRCGGGNMREFPVGVHGDGGGCLGFCTMRSRCIPAGVVRDGLGRGVSARPSWRNEEVVSRGGRPSMAARMSFSSRLTIRSET